MKIKLVNRESELLSFSGLKLTAFLIGLLMLAICFWLLSNKNGSLIVKEADTSSDVADCRDLSGEKARSCFAELQLAQLKNNQSITQIPSQESAEEMEVEIVSVGVSRDVSNTNELRVPDMYPSSFSIVIVPDKK